MLLRLRNVTPLDRRTSAADVNNCSSFKLGERVFKSLYAAMNLNSKYTVQIPSLGFSVNIT